MSLLDSSAFWGIIGLIGGILTTLIGNYIAKGRKTITYCSKSIPLIDKRIAQILDRNVTIDGTSIEALSLTTVQFDNSGNQTIEFSDFSNNLPLSIVTTGRFLPFEEGRQIVSKPPTSCIQLNVNDNKRIEIELDNIKPKEFFQIELLHDGHLSISGDLKAGKIKKWETSIWIKIIHALIYLFYCLTFVFCDGIALMSILWYFFSSETSNGEPWVFMEFLLFFGQFSLIVLLTLLEDDGFLSLHIPWPKKKSKSKRKK